ncbi:MAG: 23S rRNA (guanosine(2251)-2'-O)-methyltransferase RlmB [Sphaerochaetaceae bacterium]|jgi:23S rRNA (guanosine2251-2'-O)-methyltransferase|nr:23S rRNA (guanosine(2251)-2'-O)-methyltransferase RlmB [Sphaerochaetaceae bacterium]MDC7236460.1 23S rRNA (guanosine(2251)-2'-O)-methyltransferase RlmB [Sphaerochaetaceae bacterium]MDC7243241.1 23S rRNA (guanosine(2251)-2'-O)-methyltransferase RlmB [Sphaerochaetaceae bacterium]MDC7248378.1 23S rRNA (guanosine(2251)-2'-O)-methyltransferase RlmB [Sphaerochaetaceae bacterium]
MGEKIYGRHAIEEGLKLAPAGSTLYICRGGNNKYSDLDRMARFSQKVAVKKISKSEMDKMMPGVDHRGAILDLGGARRAVSRVNTTSVKEYLSTLEDGQGGLVLILDGITDPHNLGAILRSCDQFGVDLVIIPERRSVQANETVIKISSGAAQYVPISPVVNINREIELLKKNGFWLYAADMNGSPSYETKFASRSVIVMGSEGSGISRLVRDNCDYVVSIPMRGHIDSLNVSVAAGVLLYEVRRNS